MTNPRNSTDDAIEYAASDLPDGFTMVIEVEKGSALVALLCPSGSSEDIYFDPETGVAGAICDAVELAEKYLTLP